MKTFTDYIDELFERAEEEDERDKPDRNIVMQARKAVNMGGKKVTYDDGKTHDMSRGHAQRFLRKHAAADSKTKLSIQTHAQQSHKNFLSHAEDVETVSELDKKTLGSYIKKAASDRNAAKMDQGTAKDVYNKKPGEKVPSHSTDDMHMSSKYNEPHSKFGNKNIATIKNREQGIKRATTKLTKEDNIVEISKKTLGNYINKATKQSGNLTKQGYSKSGSDGFPTASGQKKIDKAASREKGIAKATDKLVGEKIDSKSPLPKRPPLTDKEKKFNDMMNKNKPGDFSHQKARPQEELVGKQHKLDHNKDKKIDAQDMKMVRKIGPVKEKNKKPNPDNVNQSNPDNYEPFKKKEESVKVSPLTYAQTMAEMMKGLIIKEKDTHKTKDGRTAKKGLWYNIHQKRKRGEAPAKPGNPDRPSAADLKRSQ